jgi:hypothetical protein
MPMMPPDPSLANCTATIYPVAYTPDDEGNPIRTNGDTPVVCRARATPGTIARKVEGGAIDSVAGWAVCLYLASDPEIPVDGAVDIAWDTAPDTTHHLWAAGDSYPKWAGAWGVDCSDTGPTAAV